MLKEFKKFISRGNVLDMAVGIIMGSAFTAIVTSLVNDILTPIIGLIIGGLDFEELSITIGSASIAYGSFIQAVINFLLVALSLFLIVKAINKFHFKKEQKPEAPTTKECPLCYSKIYYKNSRHTIKRIFLINTQRIFHIWYTCHLSYIIL